MAVPKAKGYRPRCFFDVTINNDKAGRIIFELFADICPKTCDNFRYLCTGEAGIGKATGKHLHFKGCPFHRVVKDFMIQGGDFTAGNGTGGESIYGGTFDDECLDLKHDRPMLLSMANRGPNTNGSQFFITTQPAPHLNGVHVIFGHVIQGIEIVQDIENQPTNEKSHPLADVRIENCGELIPKSKARAEKLKKKRQISASDKSESESESSDEEKKRKKERKRKKEKQAKKENRKGKKGSDDDNDDNETRSEKEKRESKEEPAPFSGNPLYMQSVEIDAIPDVPTSSFLMRRSRTPSPVRQKRKDQMKRSGKSPPGYRAPPQSASSSKPRRYENRGEFGRIREQISEAGFHSAMEISSSGRILRGRGQMRYRTPPPDSQRESSSRRWSRSRSRSRSPQRRRRSRSPRRSYQDSRRSTRRGRSRSRSRSPATRRNSSPGRRNGRSPTPTQRDHSRDVPHSQDRIRDGSKWERNPSPTRDSVRRERDFRGNTDRDNSVGQEEDRRSAGTEPLSHQQVPQFVSLSEDPNQLASRITNKSRWERHQSSDEEASKQTKPEAIAVEARDNTNGAKRDTDYGSNLFSSAKEQILENEGTDQRNVSEINARKRNASSSSPESGKKSRRNRRQRSRSSSESSPESKRKVSKRKSRSRSSSQRRRNQSHKRSSSDNDKKNYKSRSRERKSRSRERRSRSGEPRNSSGGRTKSRDKESSSRDRKNRSRSRDRSRKNHSREKERRSPNRSRGRRQSRSRSRGKREKNRSRSRDRRRKSSSRSRSGRRHRSRSTSKQRSSGWSKRKPRDSSSSGSD